jgi:hypothetical protein
MQSKYSPWVNLNKHGCNKVSMFVCCDSVAEEAGGGRGGLSDTEMSSILSRPKIEKCPCYAYCGFNFLEQYL